MGNTIPLSSPPKPSPSRAVIYMEPQNISGKIKIVSSTEDLPPALDGTVPSSVFEEMVTSIVHLLDTFRAGRVSFFVTISQVMIIIGVLSMLGLYVSRYVSTSFMRNPFLIGFFGFAEISLLVWSGRFVQQEENRLVKDLRELLYPWKDEYGIVSKVRKSRGTLSIGDKKKSSTYFCLILEKIGPNADYDTESLTSAFTDDESDVEDNEQPLETSLKEITSHYDLE